ncbi:hypothetical protein F1D05_23935 [Kribbella qitaiheensis]|uniref:Lipoprotein LpqN n=1 Tax=Kribbella qitaiheensis TaxID=1544730 RepID=A0A7G6X2D3_9ACTN|nr:hypothetical protein [Kribbella qitaiheensis]QNE20398.1 hypothetical protein F1D05_23935 [Kribbella qitaiheensis]
MQSPSPQTKLLGAAVAFAVLVVGGLIIRYAGSSTEQTEQTADTPTPSAQSVPPAEVVPSRNPRRDPDVDAGTPINYGVFVTIPEGWERDSFNGIRVTSRGRGAAQITVSNHPVPTAGLLRPDAETFTDMMVLENLKLGAEQQIPAPNLNTFDAARISFTSHYVEDGVTYRFAGDCTRFRGLPAVNDVSVSICYFAYAEDLDAVRAEVTAMTGSVARSI